MIRTSRYFRTTTLLATAILSLALVTGCGTGTKEQIGTVLGAGLGGLAGSFIGDGRGQLVAIAAGTLIGSFLGSEVGASLDRADRLAMASTEQNALENYPSGHPAQWHNPDSGNAGTVTPTRTWQEPSGRYCREFQATVTIGGEEHRSYGTACRAPEGQWRIQS